MKSWVIALATAGMAVTGLAHERVGGDVTRGQDKAHLHSCVDCHGPQAHDDRNLRRPRLGGIHEDYLYNQLVHFKTGGRSHPFMTPQVFGLNEQDLRDLAAYFASQPMYGDSDEVLLEERREQVELGERIYRDGLPDKGVFACVVCHGARGQGAPTARIPRIGGQDAPYMIGELQAFRSGERATDWNGVMRHITREMSDEEMQAVSLFASRLYPDP